MNRAIKVLVGLGLAAACVGIGVRIGSPTVSGRASRHTPDDDSEIRNQNPEMAKLAIAAAALQRSRETPGGDARRTNTSHPLEQPTQHPATAAEERDQHLARLEASGSAPPEFLAKVKDAEREWRAFGAAEHVDLDLSHWRCYRAGCYSTATFKDAGKVEILGARATETKSFHDWPGTKFRSGPIPGPAGIEITWIFFAPEPSQENIAESSERRE